MQMIITGASQMLIAALAYFLSFFLFFRWGGGRVRGGSSLFVHIIFGYRNDHFDCSSPM